ncbi:NYN domain-containing protein [Acetobacteraceae bacterium H6797]|nr:NYN domain-containing protein [Acetobacteraceae bacterium H6797]
MRRAALFLDFDNVFSGLCALDEGAAYDFADNPARWLAWFEQGGEGRRFLIRRCYMNPGAWYAPQPGGWLASWFDQPRVYFSRFRSAFVRAGFQVMDCPPLARSKNGADIQMTLDVVDALAAPTPIEEFFLLSSDADFTPLLHRLRLHDKVTNLVVQEAVAPALTAAADRVLALPDFAAAALPPEAQQPQGARMADDGFPTESEVDSIHDMLRQCLAASDTAVPLPKVGQWLRRVGGEWLRRSNYAGHGSLARFLRAEPAADIVATPGPYGGWIHDPGRHAPPSAEAYQEPQRPLSAGDEDDGEGIDPVSDLLGEPIRNTPRLG